MSKEISVPQSSYPESGLSELFVGIGFVKTRKGTTKVVTITDDIIYPDQIDQVIQALTELKKEIEG